MKPFLRASLLCGSALLFGSSACLPILARLKGLPFHVLDSSSPRIEASIAFSDGQLYVDGRPATETRILGRKWSRQKERFRCPSDF
jgi:hypothetical protein